MNTHRKMTFPAPSFHSVVVSCTCARAAEAAGPITVARLDYLPFFAPYLLRLRLRPSTPRASSVPRTMW